MVLQVERRGGNECWTEDGREAAEGAVRRRNRACSHSNARQFDTAWQEKGANFRVLRNYALVASRVKASMDMALNDFNAMIETDVGPHCVRAFD